MRRPVVPERCSVLIVAADADLYNLLKGELERRGWRIRPMRVQARRPWPPGQTIT